MGAPGERGGAWTLLTGHGHVLVEIARNPDARHAGKQTIGAIQDSPSIGPGQQRRHRDSGSCR